MLYAEIRQTPGNTNIYGTRKLYPLKLRLFLYYRFFAETPAAAQILML